MGVHVAIVSDGHQILNNGHHMHKRNLTQKNFRTYFYSWFKSYDSPDVFSIVAFVLALCMFHVQSSCGFAFFLSGDLVFLSLGQCA